MLLASTFFMSFASRFCVPNKTFFFLFCYFPFNSSFPFSYLWHHFFFFPGTFFFLSFILLSFSTPSFFSHFFSSIFIFFFSSLIFCNFSSTLSLPIYLWFSLFHIFSIFPFSFLFLYFFISLRLSLLICLFL